MRPNPQNIPCAEARHNGVLVVKVGPTVRARRQAKYMTKKPKHVTSHVFADTTHVVSVPRVFACVVTPAT